MNLGSETRGRSLGWNLEDDTAHSKAGLLVDWRVAVGCSQARPVDSGLWSRLASRVGKPNEGGGSPGEPQSLGGLLFSL